MLWSRAWIIVGLVVLAAIAAFVLASLQTDQYRATATVRVVDPNSEAVFDGGLQVRVDPKRDVDTQLALLSSEDLADNVDQQLGESAAQISSVTVSSVSGTDLISITVASPSPEVAAQAANLFAVTYVAQRQDQVTTGLTNRAAELRNKSVELDGQITEIDDRLGESDVPASEADVLRSQRGALVDQQAELRTRATQLEVESATRSGNVEIAETAKVPTEPFSPTPRRDAALAAALALLLGIGLVFLLDRLDDRIKSAEDVERIAGSVPVLGAIPIHSDAKSGARRLPKDGHRSLVPLKSAAAEAFRTLRTSLRFSSIDRSRRTIVITSSDQGEGKSTVVANLAVALAESGLRVVVVSADLRRPTLAGIFGVIDTERGLTTVLLGDASLVDCLTSVPLPSGRSVYLLPSGPLPQNPAELLGSRGMRDIITSLEGAGADYVLIDSPPVLPVSDALALSQFTEGVLVLTAANRTHKQHLSQTLELLQKVNADVVGVVVNGVPTRGREGGYGYGGYGYGGSGYGGHGYGVDEGLVRNPERLAATSGSESTGSVVGPLADMFSGKRSSADAPTNGAVGSSADEVAASRE